MHRFAFSTVGCASGLLTLIGCAGSITGVTEIPPDDPVVAAAFDDAAALFAANDAEERWDGETCLRTLAAFEHVNDLRGGQDGRVVYMSGLVASRCGDDRTAHDLFTRALTLEPTLCEPRVALGLRDLEAGRELEARRAFERATTDDHQCASGYVNLAILQARAPEGREDAIANLRRALAVRADYLPAMNELASIYLDGSEERPELLDLASIVCRQVQLIDAEYAPNYNTWALIDIRRGDITSAVQKLARAIELDPTFFEAQMNFGQITLSQRAYEDAARAFAAARILRPDSYDAAIGEGVARRGLRDPEAAERLYRAALEVDRDRPEAWFDLAVLYQEHRDGSGEQLEQAETYLREFTERARSQPRLAEEVQDVLRWCGERRGARGARVACQQGRAQVIHESLVLLGRREAAQRPAWTRMD